MIFLHKQKKVKKSKKLHQKNYSLNTNAPSLLTLWYFTPASVHLFSQRSILECKLEASITTIEGRYDSTSCGMRAFIYNAFALTVTPQMHTDYSTITFITTMT